jgi:hypothetical protein
MRLLNTETVKLHVFFGRKPPYAILSHRWGEDEVNYKDVMKGRNLEAAGWTKVRQCCSFVRGLGFHWVWIDTCCIDKRSSSELVESINSMYMWYQGADMCFVYLADVRCRPENVHSYKDLAPDFYGMRGMGTSRERQPEPEPIEGKTIKLFRRSKWFTRGWTLQELLAPRKLIFLDSHWNMFGSKKSLNDLVSDITGIANLASENVLEASVARKMSWAARRSCTRPEDMAYSLLGIFEVNMPLIYGEGEEQAFERLQLEIIKRSGDESIFTFYSAVDWANVLASSPRYFEESAGIRPFEPRTPRAPYSCTRKGLEISTILLPSPMSAFGHKIYFMPLNCAREGALKPMAVRLGRINDDEYFRIGTCDYMYKDRDNWLKWPEDADLDLTADIKTVKIHIINYEYGRMQKYRYDLINDKDVVEALRAAVDKYMPAHCAVGKIKDEEESLTDSI